MIRKLTCAAAAFLACGSAAFSADLPVPDPIGYVRACSIEDDDGVKRYYYVPGTDTCLAVYGYVRAESHYVNGDVALLFDGTSNSEFNNWTTRARGTLILDARTQTDLGSIRTYIELLYTIGPDDFDVNYDDTDVDLDEAYIEIAGDRSTFTAGLADSFFDFFSSDTFGTRIDVDDPTEESTLFAYSLDVTDAWTGTLSFEDPASSGRRLNGTDDYEGQKAPDVIGAIKYDKGDVSAQIMAMARWINDDNGDGLGWAAGAGLAISDIASVFGFSTQATYAEGAIGYVTTDPGGIGDIQGPNGDDTNRAWGVRSGLTADVTSSLSSWLDGSFTHVESHSGGDEYDFWTVVGGIAWTRTVGSEDVLEIGPEVGFEHIDGDDPGEDGSVWGAMMRVQSSF